MAWIEDLQIYDYDPPLVDGELAVGWLDTGHPIPTGDLSPLLRDLMIDRLTYAAAWLQTGTMDWMGTHDCAFCPGPTVPLPNNALWGSGEFRVTGKSGTVFVAPSLVAHYVEAHQYSPPAEFTEAVATGSFLVVPEEPLIQRFPRQCRASSFLYSNPAG